MNLYNGPSGGQAGADHLVRSVANPFGDRGIRVNGISPGITETPMTAGAVAVPGVMEAFRKNYPLGCYGTMADIAAACVWLASDDCFMTGENLQVNGGLTLAQAGRERRAPASGRQQIRFLDQSL